jgi:4-amino-4-deoxy-L-arabinose transferase-like glycosyltransferase
MKVFEYKIDLKWRILGLLLLLSFLYAFWQHFSADILPIHECRKSDSLTQAIQYMRGAAFLEPQTNWISPMGNRHAAAEFPIVYYIIGQIWKLTGYQLWLSKLFSLGLLMTAIISLRYFLLWFFESKQKVLVFSGIIFSAPVLIYYADTVLPNIYAFSFLLFAISACFSYLQTKSKWSYLSFTIFLSLAILIKVTALIAVLAFLGALFFSILLTNTWKSYFSDRRVYWLGLSAVSYTHLRAHETN